MFYLITNKHFISNHKSERDVLKDIILHINIEDENRSGIIGQVINFQVTPNSWREHPDLDTDVMAFNKMDYKYFDLL